MPAIKSGVRVSINNVSKLLASTNALATTEVMVGIPSNKALRSDKTGINSAELGYIHEHGAPEVGIPARPFLEPTVKDKQTSLIEPTLRKAALAAFSGDPGKVTNLLSGLGQEVADAARDRIVAGIPPKLKDATIIARARRKQAYKKAKGAKRAELRAKALEDGGTPLIDTGQLMRSITWVLRKVSRKSK